ncbi:MAG: nucleotidyltransferase family protein [Chitinophagaceae bacterium]|nr:MAG: nucleotidyltransferase family protein [Chitinophagaceae bacterium]
MQSMIFCAGLGTRFKPWTDTHPKCLALINGKSLLQRNVEYLQKAGIDRVIVNVFHFADQVIDTVEANHGWGSDIVFSDERPQVLETGGGLLFAKDLFPMGDDFICMNADILCDLDIRDMVRSHRRQDSFVTLAVSDRQSSRCFTFDQDQRLTGWRNLATGEEKTAIPSNSNQDKAFSGISVFSYDYFDFVEQTGKFSLVDSWLSLASDHPIRSFDHSGSRWVDVGRPESVAVAEALFND